LTTAIEQTVETYGIENWGAGYFDVNRKGNLIVRPVEGDPRTADVREIIDEGVTGHIVRSVEEGVCKIGAVMALDRGRVRRRRPGA